MGPNGSFIKRFTDLLLSFIALLLSAPVLLLSMIAIKLESKGPAVYTQYRTGLGGKPFKIYKLRTMVDKADKMGPLLTQQNDSRLTGVGKFLRRTSIDELPQVVNVLKGEMSIVGPRPEVTEITARYSSELSKVFAFKPGITGIAQVSGRQTLSSEARTIMEIDYYAHETFLKDLMIVLKTVKVVVTNEDNL